ncbi:type II toxin-antitoxin system CcdA family antitoxin [Acetobacter tropicalis]
MRIEMCMNMCFTPVSRAWSKAMVSQHSTSLLRGPTNETLRAQLLEEAKSLDLNILQACEQGWKSAIASIRAQQWLADNRSSFEASRQYVEENGLLLADYWNF